jgi:preprotein translocase subunit SecA
MFEDLMTDMYASIARFVYRAQLAPATPVPPPPPPLTYSGPVPDGELGVAEEAGELPAAPPQRRPLLGVNPYTAVPPRPETLRTNREETPAPAPTPAAQTVGRNDPCPCGSGKKYKQCHGRNA